MPNKDYPDHHDAEIVLKLYELRRESVMRESRKELIAKFLPTSLDDILAVVQKSDHPLNAAFRQVTSFWEMTYSMARHGIVHPDFLLESNGEGLLIFTRILPWLTEYRAAMSPNAFRNAEWVSKECEAGRAITERFRKRHEAYIAANKK